MTRRRWSLGALIGALIVAMFAVYGEWLGALSIPLAWVALIGAAIAANRILTCPACAKRLGSVFQKACSHCGAALTDRGIFVAARDRPAERAALDYMEESRRILQRWAGIRQMLGKAVYVVGIAVALLVTLGLSHRHIAEAIGLGLLVGVMGAGITWLILIYGVDNAFGAGFLLLRGRCPVCRAWFTPPTSFGPGSISTDYSLPQFCDACSAKLA